MKNFIFKSEADFHKMVFNKLDMLLSEQRHQRVDLAGIKRQLNGLTTDSDLQKQVDQYFDEDDETSPQTDTVKQDGNRISN